MHGPTFFELHREARLFAENVASVNGLLKLIEMIERVDTMTETVEVVRQTELNWQQSVHSFFYRMRSHYCYYDDVTKPFLSAIQTVQHGVRELISLKRNTLSLRSLHVLQTQDLLLTYPMNRILPVSMANLLKNLYSSSGNLSDTHAVIVQESYLYSVLSRLSLYIHLREGSIDYEQISIMTALFSRLIELGSFSYGTSTENSSGDDHKSEEDLNEQRFRELFPDHESDFVSHTEQGIEDSYNTENKPNLYGINLSEIKLSFLCGLYLRLFQPVVPKADDEMRIQDFTLAFKTAGLLQSLTLSLDRLLPERHRIGAHLYAFLLNLSPQVDSMAILYDRSSIFQTSTFDFHHDPCPWETIRAKEPLERIQNRIMKLLNAFPSNTILIVIYNVVKKLRRYELKRTSLGKMLTGLEVVLRRAQDWEQHASVHVCIDQPLTFISGIVSRWRKLELQSWPQLLDSLEKRHLRYARKSWYKLYHLIITNVGEERLDIRDERGARKLRAIPQWVKDESVNPYSPILDSSTPHLIELMKVVDTFVLTSTIGQYDERLRMIEAFARHQMIDYSSNPRPFAYAKTAGIMLEALHKYYAQFGRKVNKVKAHLRIPIEKKLADEARLA